MKNNKINTSVDELADSFGKASIKEGEKGEEGEEGEEYYGGGHHAVTFVL